MIFVRRFFMLILLVFSVSSVFSQEKPDALELYRHGKYQEAINVCLQELQERDIKTEARRRMDSYTVLGWSLLKQGKYQQALKYALQAREENRYDSRIIEIQGEALYYLGENLEALKIFEEYVSINPTGERIDLVYYYMGEIFLRLSEYNNADIAFSTALHHSPNAAYWWVRLGYTREQLGDTEGAKAAYRKALELKPSLENARTSLERLG